MEYKLQKSLLKCFPDAIRIRSEIHSTVQFIRSFAESKKTRREGKLDIIFPFFRKKYKNIAIIGIDKEHEEKDNKATLISFEMDSLVC